MSNISIDQLGDAIAAQLNTFEKSVREGVRKAVDESMDQMVKETKRTAQVRTGRYKRKISAAVDEDTLVTYSKVWHVKKPDYRLAHLLDKGHATRKGGHIDGNEHIANAEHRAVETFQRKLEEVIRDAGSEN